MLGEVVNEVIPHLRLMLVLLVTVPRIVGDGEGPARLEHERDRGFGYLHHRWRILACGFEFFVCHTVRDHYNKSALGHME